MANQTIFVIFEDDIDGAHLRIDLGYFVDEAKAQSVADQLWLDNKSSCCQGFMVEPLLPG